MNNRIIKITIIGLLLTPTLLLANNIVSDIELPEDWGLPTINFGHSSTICVPSRNNVSVDRRIAYFEARKELAQQVSFAIEVANSELSTIQVKSNETNTTQLFQEKSKSITKTTLSGSKPLKQGYVDYNGQQSYCVYMVLTKPISDTKQFLNKLSDQKEINEKEIRGLFDKYQNKINQYEDLYNIGESPLSLTEQNNR